MNGVSAGAVARLTCHGLPAETDAHGLVLVDTRFGLRDALRPTRACRPGTWRRCGRGWTRSGRRSVASGSRASRHPTCGTSC
jgi:hypothetical protein